MIDRIRRSVRLGVVLSLVIKIAIISLLGGSVSHAAAVSVYECMVDGRRTFSDQPCAPDAQSRDIADSNRMVAQDTSILSRHEPATKPHQTADDADKKKAACNKVREQQAQLQSQQRAGYTAKQGERLRVRQDKLAERYAELKCERYR